MTIFVAEVSSNHHNDLSRCLAFVDRAAEIGCHSVKFQLFKVEELFAPEILAVSEDHRRRKEWELPIEFLPSIYARCRERGVGFACTPFYLQAVQHLRPYVDFYKIASYELLWDDLLIACAKTGKPVVLSTGMATLAEVVRAAQVLKDAGAVTVTVLHCVSGYPTPLEQCNLSAMSTIEQETGCRVGWSDHTVSAAVIYRAVHRWRASMVEFHLDLDGSGDEFRIGHCWLPEQIQPVIKNCSHLSVMDGSGVKFPAKAELPDRDWRADPSDGLRPMLSKRAEWVAGNHTVQVKAFTDQTKG